MNKPTKVDFSNHRIPDEIWDAITDMLSEDYGMMPSSYSLVLMVTDIEWNEEEQ